MLLDSVTPPVAPHPDPSKGDRRLPPRWIWRTDRLWLVLCQLLCDSSTGTTNNFAPTSYLANPKLKLMPQLVYVPLAMSSAKEPTTVDESLSDKN